MRRRISLVRSFRCAGAGVIYALRTQRNPRIHAVATVIAVLLGTVLQITRVEWLALALSIGLVWTAELFNTALESIVDRISFDEHELSRIAKDCAAGAVLVAAMTSVVIGAIVFGPRFWVLWGG